MGGRQGAIVAPVKWLHQPLARQQRAIAELPREMRERLGL